MLFLPMWKLILIMLATFAVVTVVHSLVRRGKTKSSDGVPILLVNLIMIRVILTVVASLYLFVLTTPM